MRENPRPDKENCAKRAHIRQRKAVGIRIRRYRWYHDFRGPKRQTGNYLAVRWRGLRSGRYCRWTARSSRKPPKNADFPSIST